MFYIEFNNNKEEQQFNECINTISQQIIELQEDGVFFNENFVADFNELCYNRESKNEHDLELIQEIRYELNYLINNFNLTHEQIYNLSWYILKNINSLQELNIN